MQSKNPVFARSEAFNGTQNPYGNQTFPGNGAGVDAFGRQTPAYGVGTVEGHGPMSIDTVVQKTGITMLVVVVAAGLTWLLTGDISNGAYTDSSVLARLYTLSLVGAFGGFILAMVNSFKKAISPALVIAYAALEGIFVGAFSKVLEAQFGGGLVMGAVLGTMAAVGGTLAAYKFFNIQVGDKFRKWVVAMMFGFVGIALLDMVLGFFSKDFGWNGFGTLGLISSVIGLGIGVLMLILDFDYVERGIAAGLPERESWRAAFGLTVTIVWLYIEIIRILAILRGD